MFKSHKKKGSTNRSRMAGGLTRKGVGTCQYRGKGLANGTTVAEIKKEMGGVAGTVKTREWGCECTRDKSAQHIPVHIETEKEKHWESTTEVADSTPPGRFQDLVNDSPWALGEKIGTNRPDA